MKITLVQVRNFMRIVEATAVINPDGTITSVGGPNRQGKSSFLTAVESVLVGKPSHVKQAIHGENQAGSVTLTLEGENETINLTRSFVAEGDKESTKLTCSVNGVKVSSPTEVLKTIIGQLFVDPVEFMTQQPIQQLRTLLDLVGLDTTEIDSEIAAARERHKSLELTQKTLERQCEGLPWHDDAPEEEVSVTALTNELVAAQARNQENAALRAKWQRTQDAVELCSRRIAELKAELEQAESRADSLVMERDSLPLPDSDIDVTPIQEQIANAEAINAKVRDNQTRIRARQQWQDAEANVGESVALGKELVAKRKAMLAAVEFPVPGLGFDETQVTLNDKPFSQASHAEQIHASVAIALAKSGRCKPIFVHDASTMDNNAMKALAEVAEKFGAQVFAEIVANRTDDGFDRECTLYFENGEIVLPDGTPTAKAQPALPASGVPF